MAARWLARRSLAAWVVAAAAGVAQAQSIPAPEKPLVDQVRLLDAEAARDVRLVCAELERETTAELAVLITGSVYGRDHRAWGTRVFNQWGIGKRALNNGALLLFAMRDRRVELIVGVRYEPLFPPAAATRLLEEAVVPHLRAGRPAQAVLAGARAVSERIADWEARQPGGARTLEVEAPDFGGGSRGAAGPAPGPASPPLARAAAVTPRPSRTSSAARTTPTPAPAPRSALARLFPEGRDLARLCAFLLLLAWAGFLWWALQVTFSTGRLAAAKGLLYGLALLGPLVVGALLFFAAGRPEALDGVDAALGGSGLGGGALALGLLGHICPRCNKWMSIHSRTLRAATYSSAGTGERTYHCRHCRYHRVQTYTIPRRTRSTTTRSSYGSSRSSYSSSSRSSGGSSFGGGSSRGGGGGASW